MYSYEASYEILPTSYSII